MDFFLVTQTGQWEDNQIPKDNRESFHKELDLNRGLVWCNVTITVSPAALETDLLQTFLHAIIMTFNIFHYDVWSNRTYNEMVLCQKAEPTLIDLTLIDFSPLDVVSSWQSDSGACAYDLVEFCFFLTVGGRWLGRWQAELRETSQVDVAAGVGGEGGGAMMSNVFMMMSDMESVSVRAQRQESQPGGAQLFVAVRVVLWSEINPHYC